MQQKGTLKTLQLLHRAMLIGLILLSAIAVFVVYQNKFTPSFIHIDKALQIVALVVSFAAVFIGSTILKKNIQQGRSSNCTTLQKMKLYRAACFIQWPLLIVAGLFCNVCFFLTANLAYIALAATLVLWLALAIPTKTKLMILFGISEKEMEEV